MLAFHHGPATQSQFVNKVDLVPFPCPLFLKWTSSASGILAFCVCLFVFFKCCAKLQLLNVNEEFYCPITDVSFKSLQNGKDQAQRASHTCFIKQFLLGILKKQQQKKTKTKKTPNPAQACFSKYQIHYYAHWLVKYLQTSVSYCPDTEAVLPSSSTPRVETSTWVLFTFRE